MFLTPIRVPALPALQSTSIDTPAAVPLPYQLEARRALSGALCKPSTLLLLIPLPRTTPSTLSCPVVSSLAQAASTLCALQTLHPPPLNPLHSLGHRQALKPQLSLLCARCKRYTRLLLPSLPSLNPVHSLAHQRALQPQLPVRAANPTPAACTHLPIGELSSLSCLSSATTRFSLYSSRNTGSCTGMRIMMCK